MTLAITSIYCWVIFLQMVFLTIDQGIPSANIITDISHIGWGAGINGNSTLWLWSKNPVELYDCDFIHKVHGRMPFGTNVIELQKRHGHGLSTITFGYLSGILQTNKRLLLINYRANLT